MESLPAPILISLVLLFGTGLLWCANRYLNGREKRDKLFEDEIRRIGTITARTINMLSIQQEQTKTLFANQARHEAHLQRHDEIIRLRAQGRGG